MRIKLCTGIRIRLNGIPTSGGGSGIPSDAVLYDDDTPVFYDDDTYLLYEV